MERAILVIVLIVALVGVVGLFASRPFPADALTGQDNGISGHVVAEPGMAMNCNTCVGFSPVCGKRNHWYITYPNACTAECDGASIEAEYACEHIPAR